MINLNRFVIIAQSLVIWSHWYYDKSSKYDLKQETNYEQNNNLCNILSTMIYII